MLTIHQPSFRILELMHNLLVLARGMVVYHGSYDALLGHLSDFGHPVPDDVSIALHLDEWTPLSGVRLRTHLM